MRRRLLLALPVALVAACGGHAGPTPLTAPPLAASAPPTTITAAGSSVSLAADRPEGVAAAGDDVVVDTQDGRLLELGPAGAVLRTYALGGSGRHVRVAGGDALVPLEGAAQLAVVDLASGTVAHVAVGRAPHDVVPISGDRALVGDEADGAVSVVDLAAERVTATLPAGLAPGGLAADGGYACAVDVKGRYLYRYAVTPTGVTAAGRVAVGSAPTHVVDVGGGTVAVADAYGDAIDLVDLAALRVVATIPLGASPEGLAVGGGELWVTEPGADRLAEVDIATRRVVATFPTVRQANSDTVTAGGTVVVAGATDPGTVQLLRP